ncbi:hypothetical protein VB715_07880 [Crocosphaera sp. UHCC 0190]|uniref:hypothetical protein n=1 Tax=Crocosphaera sp. UHCC 0190 TaxID=3110246 RepID=UPI002B212C21|nr:hypothetical protein [Crocosphaera sp. UHCC 0190]MEA5509681.1 hypothetical protein [Crocosphaera sp. UHCC 0190]
MSKVTENDLKRLEDLINDRFDRLEEGQKTLEGGQKTLEEGQKTLEKGQTEIKERLAVIETRQADWKPSMDKIPDLAEKVGELKNWRQIVIITITSTISGLVGWVIRGGTLKP